MNHFGQLVIDDIRTRHANQHIPMIIGALRSYKSNQKPYYYNLAENFWRRAIDQIPCDLDPSQRIALDYDAQDLADVRSGNKGHALRAENRRNAGWA